MSKSVKVVLYLYPVETDDGYRIGGFGYYGTVIDSKKTSGLSGYYSSTTGLTKNDSKEYVDIDKFIDFSVFVSKDSFYKDITDSIGKYLNTEYDIAIIFPKNGYKKYITDNSVSVLIIRPEDNNPGIVYARSNSEIGKMSDFTLAEDKKTRWKTDISLPDTIPVPNIIVNLSETISTNTYYGYKTPTDMDPGLRSGKIALCLMKTKKEDIIEDVVSKRRSIRDYVTLMEVDVRSLYKRDTLKIYERFGTKALTIAETKPPRSVSVVGAGVVGRDLFPPKLAMNLISKFQTLECIYNAFIDVMSEEDALYPYDIDITDITDVCLSHMSPSDKEIRLDNKRTLIYGIELPPRNIMKRLLGKGSDSSRLYLFTERIESVRKIHAIIHSETSTVIWSNVDNFII